MDQNALPTELQLLLDIQDTQREAASTLMAQVVELQASLSVMIDLQKRALVSSGHFVEAELDDFCKQKMAIYRRHCLVVIKENVALAKKLLEVDEGKVM